MEARDGIEPPRRSADPSPFVSASAPSLTTVNCKQGRKCELRSSVFHFHESPSPERIDERVLGESRLEESILASTGDAIDSE
jgi:hypothetical protein